MSRLKLWKECFRWMVFAILFSVACSPVFAHKDPPGPPEVEELLYLHSLTLTEDEDDGLNGTTEILVRIETTHPDHDTGEWLFVVEEIDMDPPNETSFKVLDGHLEAEERKGGKKLIYSHVECEPTTSMIVDIDVLELNTFGLSGVLTAISKAASTLADAGFKKDGARLVGAAADATREVFESIADKETNLGSISQEAPLGVSEEVAPTVKYNFQTEYKKKILDEDQCGGDAKSSALERLKDPDLDPGLVGEYELVRLGFDAEHPFTQNVEAAEDRLPNLHDALTATDQVGVEEDEVVEDLEQILAALRDYIVRMPHDSLQLEIDEAIAGLLDADIIDAAMGLLSAGETSAGLGAFAEALDFYQQGILLLLALNHPEFNQPDIPAPVQLRNDHSTVATTDGSIRDDELLDFVCEQINENGGKVKDVKLMVNSCYGGGLLDDMERVFGTGGACEGIPWVGGSASEMDKAAYGWPDEMVDKFPDEALGSTWTDALAGNSHFNEETKAGVIRNGSDTNNVLQDLQAAGENDDSGPNGDGMEKPQVASGNGGHAIAWNMEGAKHEAVVFGGMQTDKRHSNNVENMEAALAKTWEGHPHNIQALDGGSEQDLKDAIIAAAKRLDENTQLVIYLDDHGGTHKDNDDPPLELIEDTEAWVFDLGDGWFDGLFGNFFAVPEESPVPTLDLFIEQCEDCADWIYRLNGNILEFPLLDEPPDGPFLAQLPIDFVDLRPGMSDSNIFEIIPPFAVNVPSSGTTAIIPGGSLQLSAMRVDSGPVNELMKGQVLVPGQSAAYYDDNRSGEGIFTELLDNGLAVVYMFSHNLDGSGQSWVVGLGRQVGSGIIVHDMQMPVGGIFGPEFDPDDVVRTDFGSLFFQPPACEKNAVPGSLFIYPETTTGYEDLLNDNYIQLSLLAECDAATQQGGGTVAATSADTTLSGSYYDPTHSGEGIILQVLINGVVVVNWFTFDMNGNQMWIQGTGSIQEDTITIDNLFTTHGTTWGSGFETGDITTVPWGSLTLVFNNCGSATLNYVSTAGFGSGTLNMVRLTSLMGLACTD